ncbi:MAG TPA: dihydrofolate reductase family protein [Verrucomicrobiae bacterium]|nr:dihydrofolate reductase family protein [Verrucomicrobiae bacterium]
MKPFVFINMAMTADGKIATANRAISSFGSKDDQDHLLELRATADAVMAGARTVDSADVNMGPGPARFRAMRIKRGLAEYNLRIIVSRSGSINPGAAIFKHPFSPILILTTDAAPKSRVKKLRDLADKVESFGDREIDFPAALAWLHKQWGVKRLLCEGGGELNDAVVRAGLVDEIHLTVCPFIFAGREAPTIADGAGVSNLASAAQFELKSRRRVGAEMFLVYRARVALRPPNSVA